jgi:nucleoside-diphosphate-sugar epimerase
LVRREAPELIKKGVELVPGDVTNMDTLRTAVRGIEAVFHLAAVRDVWGAPAAIYQHVNVEGTRYLLEAAAESGIQRFVYCSSVGVARYPGNLAADETLPYSEPTSQVLYHRTKAQAEQIALDAQAVVVRPVITYGPGDENGFLTRLIELLIQGRFLGIGNGRNHVDLVYVDDLIAGMVAALEKGAAGRVYILSGTAPIQVRVLLAEICKLLGRKPPYVYVPTPITLMAGWGMEMLWHGIVKPMGWSDQSPFITRDKVATLTVDRGFSHKRASLELGYRPQIDYSEGIQRTLAWILGKTVSEYEAD